MQQRIRRGAAPETDLSYCTNERTAGICIPRDVRHARSLAQKIATPAARRRMRSVGRKPNAMREGSVPLRTVTDGDGTTPGCSASPVTERAGSVRTSDSGCTDGQADRLTTCEPRALPGPKRRWVVAGRDNRTTSLGSRSRRVRSGQVRHAGRGTADGQSAGNRGGDVPLPLCGWI